MTTSTALLPRCGCPSCNGFGTVLVADLAQPGHEFPVVCSRCGGVGSVPTGFGLAPREERSTDEVEDDIKW